MKKSELRQLIKEEIERIKLNEDWLDDKGLNSKTISKTLESFIKNFNKQNENNNDYILKLNKNEYQWHENDAFIGATILKKEDGKAYKPNSWSSKINNARKMSANELKSIIPIFNKYISKFKHFKNTKVVKITTNSIRFKYDDVV